jgi:8-oxo-dGTP pyrophosphatase MutT (NUDIX family)
MIPTPTPSTAAVPDWLRPLLNALKSVGASDLSRFTPPADGSGRHSAVLILFAGGEHVGGAGGERSQSAGGEHVGGAGGERSQSAEGEHVGGAGGERSQSAGGEHVGGWPERADVLLLQRASTLRSHAGQVAFPGGATDPEDASTAATALREATEEVGLRAETVDILTELPAVYLPPSGFVVTPVLAHWRMPHPVGVVDVGEVAGVERVRITDLVDPANRFTVKHPSGYSGPGFAANNLFVWGFTAGLLDRLVRLAGWEKPWNRDVFRPLPD